MQAFSLWAHTSYGRAHSDYWVVGGGVWGCVCVGGGIVLLLYGRAHSDHWVGGGGGGGVIHTGHILNRVMTLEHFLMTFGKRYLTIMRQRVYKLKTNCCSR